jgi:ABC-type transport system substrate-binding protein
MEREQLAVSLSRRAFLRGLAITTGGATIAALAACAPAPAPSAPAGEAPAAPSEASAEVPATGTSDVRVLWSKPTNLSPFFSTNGFEQQVLRLTLGSVFKLSDTLEPVPDLAESWEISEDSTTFTFHLREGLVWSDGAPLTVDDIIFTIERASDSRTGSTQKGRLSAIEGATAYGDQQADSISGLIKVDDRTLTIKLSAPNAAFLTSMGTFSGFNVVPKHILEDVAPENMKEHPFSQAPTVGAGPYTFVRYETDQYAELVRNPNYWGPAPAIERIFMTIATPDVAVAQLQRGEMDLMNVPVEEVDRLSNDPNITIMSVRSPSISQIAINNERPYFQDKRVRQAMMYAIDRQGIVDSIMFGQATVVNSPVIGPDWVGTPEVNEYPFDPDKARELLAEAGWDPNQQVDMIYTQGTKEQDAYGAVIQQQLRDVGIQCNLVLIEGAELNRRYIQETDYDLFLFGGGLYRAEPSLTGQYYYSHNLTPAGGNGTHYVNPELDELLNAGVATSNLEERAKIYHQVAKIINEDVPTVFLWSPNSIYGVSKRLQGFVPPSYVASLLWNAEEWSLA